MGRQLVGVRIKAVDRDVENSRAQLGVDKLGSQLQFVGKRRIRVRDFGLIVLADFVKPLAAPRVRFLSESVSRPKFFWIS